MSSSEVILLIGGSRDGQVTRIDEHIRRLYTPSNAPGLLDVYDRNGTRSFPDPPASPGHDSVPVLEFTGQVPIDDVAPELIHMPGANPVPGDT